MRLGVFILCVGVVLVIGGSSYFAYSLREHSRLDELNAEAPIVIDRVVLSMSNGQSSVGMHVDSEFPKSVDGQEGSSSHPATRYVLYPGEWIPPAFWDNPLGAEDVASTVDALLSQFEIVESIDQLDFVQSAPPVRITIPAIQVDSPVAELAILDLSDSRSYETPKNVVGYISKTGDLGRTGNAWFFGHLESPIRGEGSVFSKLPEIPLLWKRGIDVYAVVESEKASYLYRLTTSIQVHEDDLSIYQGEGSSINLVTCVPRFSYDHRQIITGTLVGIKY
ncbi:sortase [SAR202 cluster bacterium AD-804-J14_MRT_500m]|nr:sortase [SAR202 cluster bacterium AD-804-J14_MRT_500m]